jgi:hypothetical protein
MKKLVFSVLLLLITIVGAFSQEKYFYINLDVNKPLSNTEWIGNTSASGIRGGYRFFINPRISAGLDLGWTTYDQYRDTETYQTGTGAMTTDYFKYIYNYSAVISGQYNFPVGDRERFFPYAGLGLGANKNNYVLYYNIYEDEDRSWGFLARPEAGILVKFGTRRSLGAMAAVHYDFATNKSDMFEYSNFSTVGFQIGLVFLRM